MSGNNHIPEQKMIDYLLDNLHHDEQELIKHHLDCCDSCNHLRKNWMGVLDKNESDERKPSESLKKSLDDQFAKKHKTTKRKQIPKLAYGIGSMAAAVCLLIGLMTLSDSVIVQNQIAVDEQFDPETGTNQIDVMPITNMNNNPAFWSGKGLQKIDTGTLNRLYDKEYQLWIIYMNDEIKRVLLPKRIGFDGSFYNMNKLYQRYEKNSDILIIKSNQVFDRYLLERKMEKLNQSSLDDSF